VTATTIYRVDNGQLSEHWGETDSLTLMQQLGAPCSCSPRWIAAGPPPDARTPLFGA
jgi:hypothetical protein